MTLTHEQKVTILVSLEDRIQKCAARIESEVNDDQEFWAKEWKNAHDAYNKIVDQQCPVKNLLDGKDSK